MGGERNGCFRGEVGQERPVAEPQRGCELRRRVERSAAGSFWVHLKRTGAKADPRIGRCQPFRSRSTKDLSRATLRRIMQATIQRLRFALPVLLALSAALCTGPGLAGENIKITHCFPLASPLSPPKVTKGSVFVLPGALVIIGTSEFDADDLKFITPAFRTSQDDKILALQDMYDPCGVHISLRYGSRVLGEGILNTPISNRYAILFRIGEIDDA